jgi:peptide/nickel transport system substrate-binding protein
MGSRGVKTGVAFALLAACFLLFAGCVDKDRKERPHAVIIANSSEPHTLNPVFLSDLNSYTISGWIFNGLTKLDKDLNIAGDLADSWEVSEDGLTIVFHLRKGVLWHDGTEFTSRDVVFTYRTITSKGVATPHGARFGPVKDIRASDPYTVKITYGEPYGSALISWTTGIIPEHMFRNKDINDGAFGRLPVGTGPYRLKEWISGERLVLEAFAGYFRGRPNIPRLIVKVIPDPAARMLEAKTGAIDMTELAPIQFATQTNTDHFVRNFTRYCSPSFRYGFLGFNLRDPRFRDKRVRQAISHAIDKDAIIGAVLLSFGKRSTGPYPPLSPYAGPSAPYFEYDPLKATDLLVKAGWQKGKDGLLRKNGRPFSFTIVTNYESEENIKTAQIIENSLKRIGIEVKILTLEWQMFRHTVIKEHAFEAIILSRAYMGDPDLYDLWHSSKTKEGDWNFLSYRNSEVDRLLETGRRTLKIEKRKQIYRRVHEIIADEQPCVFLYDAEGLFIADKRIRGIEPSLAGVYHNIEAWSSVK